MYWVDVEGHELAFEGAGAMLFRRNDSRRCVRRVRAVSRADAPPCLSSSATRYFTWSSGLVAPHSCDESRLCASVRPVAELHRPGRARGCDRVIRNPQMVVLAASAQTLNPFQLLRFLELRRIGHPSFEILATNSLSKLTD
jgi:hypothetical protein